MVLRLLRAGAPRVAVHRAVRQVVGDHVLGRLAADRRMGVDGEGEMTGLQKLVEWWDNLPQHIAGSIYSNDLIMRKARQLLAEEKATADEAKGEERLREWLANSFEGLASNDHCYKMDSSYRHGVMALYDVLVKSCHPAPVTEPLAVLAERKNYRISGITNGELWVIEITGFDIYKEFADATYSAAEQEARQYLEELPDVAKGRKK